MSFLRHRKIYRVDKIGKRGSRAAAPDHRFDEFPAGYSLAGCSPAEPASASPVTRSIGGPIRRDNEISANGDSSLFFVSQGWGPLQAVPHYSHYSRITRPALLALLFSAVRGHRFGCSSSVRIACLNPRYHLRAASESSALIRR